MQYTLCIMVMFPFILAGFNFHKALAKSFGGTQHAQSYESKIDACEQIVTWEQIYEAKTMDGNVAQIVQSDENGPQLFYTVKCRPERENLPCHGIDSSIQSRCETRHNAVAALIFDESAPTGLRWEMIMVPGQCVCAEFLANATRIL